MIEEIQLIWMQVILLSVQVGLLALTLKRYFAFRKATKETIERYLVGRLKRL